MTFKYFVIFVFQVLIKVHAIGVNPVETYFRSGSFGSKLPFTPGTDCAGVVAQVGADVTRLQVGCRDSNPRAFFQTLVLGL